MKKSGKYITHRKRHSTKLGEFPVTILFLIVTSALVSFIICACTQKRPTTTEVVATTSHVTFHEETNVVTEIISSETTEESLKSTFSETEQSETKEITFQTLYRGFTAIQLEDSESYSRFSEAGTQIIQSEESWQIFMGQYCPGIPYYINVDFSKECLIGSVIGFASPAYTSTSELTRLKIENGRLLYERSEDPSTYIYALNSNNTCHFFVEILVVNREELPDGLL